MPISIKVENLSKKYIIRHQSREKYTALRDVVGNSFKNIVQRVLHPRSRSGITIKEDFNAVNDVSFEITQGPRTWSR